MGERPFQLTKMDQSIQEIWPSSSVNIKVHNRIFPRNFKKRNLLIAAEASDGRFLAPNKTSSGRLECFDVLLFSHKSEKWHRLDTLVNTSQFRGDKKKHFLQVNSKIRWPKQKNTKEKTKKKLLPDQFVETRLIIKFQSFVL